MANLNQPLESKVSPGRSEDKRGLLGVGSWRKVSGKREENSFLHGALVLAGAGLGSRALGAIYRIILPRFLGREGMGLYDTAYLVYSLVLGFSSVGVPIAISKLVAERVAQKDSLGVQRVFRVSEALLATFGLVFSVGLWLGAPFLSQYVYVDRRTYYPLVAVAPAIFFVSILAGLRGFFQGMQMMAPSAVSQIVEQVVRVATVFALTFLFLPRGIGYAAAGAAFGATTGAIFGLFYLIKCFFTHRAELRVPGRKQRASTPGNLEILHQVIAITIPISLAAIVLPIMGVIDSTVVPARLMATGYSPSEATGQFGLLRYASVLVNLPMMVTGALAISLVPSISEARVMVDLPAVRSRASTAVRMAVSFTLPAAGGLYLLAPGITDLLYGAPEAGPALAALSTGLVFLGLQQVTSGILQGMGHPELPVRNLCFGAVVKVALTWILTVELGIRGAALASAVGFATACTLNLICTYRAVGGFLEPGKHFLKPAFSVLVMAVVVKATHSYLATLFESSAFPTLGSIAAGILTYGFVLAAVGGLTARDVEAIPGLGPALSSSLRRFGVLVK